MKRKPTNQLCTLAVLSVPRHAACSMCASDTCTVRFICVCVEKGVEVQV